MIPSLGCAVELRRGLAPRPSSFPALRPCGLPPRDAVAGEGLRERRPMRYCLVAPGGSTGTAHSISLAHSTEQNSDTSEAGLGDVLPHRWHTVGRGAWTFAYHAAEQIGLGVMRRTV